MDLGEPIRSVITTLHGPVLATLVRAGAPLSSGDVARLGAGSERGVQYALRDLVESGLVIREEVGRMAAYRFNDDHLAAGPIRRLARLREALVRRLREAIGEWQLQPVSAALYGSAARGDGSAESDIDLFFVRPDADEDTDAWDEQVAHLVGEVQRWTGNRVDVLEFAVGELTADLWLREPILRDVQRDGIVIGGERLRRPVRRVRKRVAR